ncbi:hypothetical protein D3C87_1943200 [compost metagenome]
MRFHGRFPFRCARVVYLRAFLVAYARVDVPHACKRKLNGFLLVLQKAFMHIAPMRNIECEP